jgi:hypothetical protein
MPSIQALSDIKRTVAVPWGEDEVIHVTYRLAALNVHLSDWLQENGSDRGSLMVWIERVVTAWDITDAGQPIPPTRDEIERREFSTALLRMIMDAIYDDSQAGNLSKAFGTRFLELDASRSGTHS